jgi:hypothetical protein
LAFLAIRQPVVKEEKTIKNIIEEKESYDCLIKVKPCLLYPDGGIAAPDGVIFNSLTDQLIIKLDLRINTQEAVRVEGSSGVVYSLVAKDMWEREFTAAETESFHTEGVSNDLLHKEIRIDINDILKLIQSIEEETAVRPNAYSIIIKPKVNGTVYQQNGEKIYEAVSDLAIPFELTGQYMKFAGESAENEFTDTKTIEDVNMVPQSFNILGMELPVTGARLVLGTISILSVLPLIKFLIKKKKSKKPEESEFSLIDKKHKGKIIEVSDKLSFNMLPQLGLKNFNVLLKIAEEKEEPILKFSDVGKVYYYVLGTSGIYYYGIEKNCG